MIDSMHLMLPDRTTVIYKCWLTITTTLKRVCPEAEMSHGGLQRSEDRQPHWHFNR